MESQGHPMLTDRRRQVDALKLRLSHARQTAAAEEENLDQAKKDVSDCEAAQSLLQECAKRIQSLAHRQIASVVTRCLRTVFGEKAYSFAINFHKARGKTEARLVFVRDGQEINPSDAAGGGVVDVCSFALRLACLLLQRPAKRRLLVLDEPWKHLSAEYRPLMGELLLELCRELQLQVIMVTHSEEFQVGKVVRL